MGTGSMEESLGCQLHILRGQGGMGDYVVHIYKDHGMRLCLEVSTCTVQTGMEALTAKFQRSRSGLSHANYAMEQYWEVKNVHYSILSSKVTKIGLILCNSQLRGRQKKLS